MARKQRDYKAEYARRKARATRAGFSGVRAASRHKKLTEWSKTHSRKRETRVPTGKATGPRRAPAKWSEEQERDFDRLVRNARNKRDVWRYARKWEGDTRPFSEAWKSDFKPR